MKIVSASASAKIILVGEHAVVYGQPAIAVPVSTLRAQATCQASQEPFQIIAEDLEIPPIALDSDEALAQMANLTLQHLHVSPPNATIRVTSQIPIASGMGSGAAISTAIGRVLALYYGQSIAPEELNHLVYQVEKIHHGTPSGIDNTVIVYERPIYFVREQGIQPVENRRSFRLLIADTGKRALTKVAVGDVRNLRETYPQQTQQTIMTIGTLVAAAKAAMSSGDHQALGQIMSENHEQLQLLTVSCVELDNLVDVARQAGALGAKLSGGGRGGNMIALVTDETAERVRKALLHAGAVTVFDTLVARSDQVPLV